MSYACKLPNYVRDIIKSAYLHSESFLRVSQVLKEDRRTRKMKISRKRIIYELQDMKIYAGPSAAPEWVREIMIQYYAERPSAGHVFRALRRDERTAALKISELRVRIALEEMGCKTHQRHRGASMYDAQLGRI